MDAASEMTTSLFTFLLVLAVPALAFNALPPGALDLLVGVAAQVDELLCSREAESRPTKDRDGYKDRSYELV